jgi:arsenical pump membrane protein
MGQLGAISILSLTIGLSLSRPRVGPVRIQPATAAMFGATLTVAVGLLSPLEAWEVLEFLARPVLTIVSLMIITIVASRAGFFRILAWRLATSAGGNSRRLLARLFFAGTITGTLFTNDAAVLIFTPMVFQLVEEIRDPTWTDANRVPFYFAVLYVANLVGALVISNPINIIVADWFGIGFVEYAFWMVLPAVVSMIVTYFGLVFFFRRSIPATYRVPTSIEPSAQGRKLRAATAVVLIATLIGFFSEPWSGIPTAFVAATGALLLLLLYHLFGPERIFGPKRTRGVVAEVGWDAVIFVVGIFIVANGLRAVGLTDTIGVLLLMASEVGQQAGNFAAGLIAAVSSAVMNNHPTAGIMALAIGDLPVDSATRQGMAFAALIGGDLGPKMLPVGSLAALLWFRILRSRGVEISYWQYVKLGVPVTLAAVVLSLGVLALEYSLFL